MVIPAWLFYFSLLLLGLILGSFYNVCIYRLPREESIVWPGSHCPICRHPLSILDNLPLVSFLLLKRTCRYCHGPISYQYPLVEAVSGLGTVLIGWKFGLSWLFPQALLLFGLLLIISVIDLFHRIIPNVLTYPGIVVGWIFSWLIGLPGWQSSLIGIGVGGGLLWLLAFGYERLAHKEGLGGGDIKLLAMIGAFQGWPGVLISVFMGSFIGTLVGLPVVIWKKDRSYQIPFGPFLSLGSLIGLFFGPIFLNRYLR
jgi:leader peptidase (prepilin peptidase) / N-methyltransferase